MNCRECEELTAEFLGGELPEDRLSAFSEHLSGCSDCEQRVGDLTDCQMVLERLNAAPDDVAQERTQSLHIVRRRSLGTRIALTLLRTAAVLALGVFVGRYTAEQSTALTADSQTETGIVASSVSPIHPGWLKLAGDTESKPSTLAGQLAMLARSGR